VNSNSTINPALGTDLSGVSDLTATMAESSGRQCFGEALARRLITPRGGLIDDDNYGYDLTSFANDDIGQGDVQQIQSNVEAEFLKDERVIAAAVTVQFVGASQVAAAQSGTVSAPAPGTAGVLVVTATITDSLGPFTLTVSVSALTVSLLMGST
jgi:hypothetical protein